MGGSRSRARDLALQYLYCVDLLEEAPAPVDFGDFVATFGARGADLAYAEKLVERVRSRLREIDDLIGAAARNWDVSRMSTVERNILRMGCAELGPGSDVPPASVIDEAVELAKEYGDKASGSFVNGVLDAVLRSMSDAGGTEVARGE